MDASQLPKGKSAEKTPDGRAINQPGIYVHKDTGATFITAPGEEGVLQADALQSPAWKDAWEWKGEAPSRSEVLEMQKAQLAKDKKAEEAAKKAETQEEEKLPPGGETYDPTDSDKKKG